MKGERLGEYVIDRELGSGGMGKVYAATGPEGVVAIKVVHPHLMEAPGFFKRFLREAQSGQSVTHDNVVRTLDCDAVAGHHYLVMEYVEGQTLGELLTELERVPEELCRHVGREICKGLSAIHDAGVVHRDLKPENVLITPDHVVKVMDLGVARLVDEQLRLSQSGAFIGSAEYAAPEQFGGDVDQRCDLHALGLLLYELSCGQNPYRGDDFRSVMRRICDEAPRRVGDVNPQVSAFFEEVIHTLLVKDPRGRFTSATRLLDVLRDGEDSAWWHERARSLQADTKSPIRRIRIPRETAVYGRDEELATLRSLYETAKSGEGQVVLIEGEAGIGKSRLVDELIARLQSDGEDLNFLFGSYPPGGAATAAGGFSAAFRGHFGEAGSAGYLTQTPLLVPAYDAVLRGEPAPEGAQELTADALGTCFVHATRSLAADRTTVVLIDDLHFAPDEARKLFTAIAMAVPEHRVLLVGTFRPGVPNEWAANLARIDHTTRFDLHRLGPKHLARLLKDSFRSEELARSLALQIGEKSDGNPFFVFEIIRGLREGQLITQRDDGTWATTRIIDEIQIPSSVLELVNARVAVLTEDERALLDVAACWGYEFDPGLIGDVLGQARIPTLRAFGQIERQHRLVRASGRKMVFDHHQVQEALYGSLLEQLREEYHAAIAETLETRAAAAATEPNELDGALCVDLCEHYLKGARGPAALRYLTAAQTHLQKGYLSAQVVSLTERALAVPDLLSGSARVEALLRLSDALDILGRRERQEKCAREAEQLADAAADDELLGRAASALGTLFYKTARLEAAEAAFRRAHDLAVTRGDRKAEAGSTVNLGTVLRAQGRLQDAQEHHERAAAICDEIGERGFAASAAGNLGTVFDTQGRLQEAREQYERSLALHRACGHRQGEANVLGDLGGLFAVQGRLREAQELFERSLAIHREIGDRAGEVVAGGNLGNVFADQGRLSEARKQVERNLALSREIGGRKSDAYAHHNLGVVLGELGERDASEEHLETCLALCQKTGHRYLEAVTHLALGSVRASEGDEGDVGERRSALVAARDLAREIGVPAVEVFARCELSVLEASPEDALAAYTEHAERLSDAHRRGAQFLLWTVTGDRAHLGEAKHLLDEALESVPEEYRPSVCQNLRVNREILAAWHAEFGGDDDEPPGSTESVTRVG